MLPIAIGAAVALLPIMDQPGSTSGGAKGTIGDFIAGKVGITGKVPAAGILVGVAAWYAAKKFL